MFTYLAITTLLDCPIRANSVDGSTIRWHCNWWITTRFQNTFTVSFKCKHVPFVNSTIHTAGNEFGIIRSPTDASHLLNRDTYLFNYCAKTGDYLLLITLEYVMKLEFRCQFRDKIWSYLHQITVIFVLWIIYGLEHNLDLR